MWRDWALAPVLLAQGLWVATRALRLPEAAGPREGVAGQGPRIGLLIVGDSSAAGVGVASQDEALAGQVVAALSRSHRVHWRLLARSGATVISAADLLRAAPAGRFDLGLVALGVNDAKNGMRLRRFEAGYGALLAGMRDRFGVGGVVLSGVPPMAEFPALPSPLRDVLGRRAALFDASVRQIAAEHGGRHLPLDFTRDAAQMAEDGFHPGPAIHAEWGRRAARYLRGMT